MGGNPNFIEFLMHSEFEIGKWNNLTPLDLVLKKNSKAVKELLLRNATELKITTIKERLHSAAKCGDEEVLRMISENKMEINVNAKIKKSHTALHVAAAYGHVNVVEKLIKLGAVVDVQTHKGETPLHFAAAAGHVSVVRCLLDNGADATKNSDRNLTALHYALDRKMYNQVISSKFNTNNFKCHSLNNLHPSLYEIVTITPTSFAACVAITEMLLIEDTSGNAHNHEVFWTLSLAAKIRVSTASNTKSSVKSSSKSDVPTKAKQQLKNTTSLQVSEGQFRPDLFKCLLNYGADVDVFWKDYLRFCSAELYCGDLVEILLQYKRDTILNSSVDYLRLCFHHASLLRQNVKELVLTLIEHDSSSNTITQLVHLVNECFPYNRNRIQNTNIMEFLIPAVVKVQAADQVFSDEDLRNIVKGNLTENYTKCELEIMLMRETKIDDQDVTFYDIITKPIDKLAKYVRNEDLVHILESDAYKMFPTYAPWLGRCLKRGKERKMLHESSADSFFNLIHRLHKIELPDLVLFKILEFLPVAELHKLSSLDEPPEGCKIRIGQNPIERRFAAAASRGYHQWQDERGGWGWRGILIAMSFLFLFKLMRDRIPIR